MPATTDQLMNVFTMLLARIRSLDGPTIEQIAAAHEVDPDTRASDGHLNLRQAVKGFIDVGAVEARDGGRLYLTTTGELFLRAQAPSLSVQHKVVTGTLKFIHSLNGPTLQELAAHPKTGPSNGVLLKALFERLVENGAVEIRDGRYFLSEESLRLLESGLPEELEPHKHDPYFTVTAGVQEVTGARAVVLFIIEGHHGSACSMAGGPPDELPEMLEELARDVRIIQAKAAASAPPRAEKPN